MEHQIADLVSDFNKRIVVLVNYSNAITTAYGIGSTGLEKEIIGTVLKQMNDLEKTNSNKIIDTFVMNILANYEDELMAGDDATFISKIVVDTKKENSGGAVFNILFSVVNIWGLLQPDQKTYIKSTLKTLCIISRAYCDIIIKMHEDK